MLAEQIREARVRGDAIRIVGGGHWLGAGRPVEARSTLSLADQRGVVEYVPGDLTLTARAGTSIAELYAATKAAGQWLPLDPWGGDNGTIGATVTTATAGPHAHALGLPRDVVLGLEFISGAGDTIRAGGRVVKNVAGFDLTRLLIGSWGTLGVVTEVTVRLRARPSHLRTLCFPVEGSAATLNQLAMQLRALPFTPLAAELLSSSLASQLGLERRAALLVRVGGNEPSLAGQVDLLRTVGTAYDAPSGAWSALRSCDAGYQGTWRFSGLPSRFGDTWVAAEEAIRELEDAALHGSVLRGVVRVCGSHSDPAYLARRATSFAGSVVVERLPANAWAVMPQPTRDGLHAALRSRFDPGNILNRGIMGGAA